MGSQKARKQAEAAQKFAEVVAEKGTSSNISLCVKDVSGSLNKVNASVIKLMHSLLSPCICLFCLSVLSLAAYVGVVER